MSLRSEIVRILNELLSGSKKITELPTADTLTGLEYVEVVQDGFNKKVATANISGGTFDLSGVVQHRGNFSLAANLFPSTGGTGSGGTVEENNRWFITVGSTTLLDENGDQIPAGVFIEAKVDSPSTTDISDWWIIQEGVDVGVQSVTGDGVDNTDPQNPVIDLLSSRTVSSADAIEQGDNLHTVYFDSATPFNFTIDELAVNSRVDLINIGSDVVTLVNGTGVTFSGPSTVSPGGVSTVVYVTGTEPIVFGSELVDLATDVTGDLPFSNVQQIAGLSVAGTPTTSTADLSAITGTANQVLRINGAGTANAFGSLDLSQTATVGTSILPEANGGTGVATLDNAVWKVGGNTLSGTSSVGSSSNNTVIIKTNNVDRITLNANGKYTYTNTSQTATANNETIISETGAITGRATTSDNVYYRTISPTLTAGANSQRLIGLFLNPTFASGGFTTDVSHSLVTGSGSVAFGGYNAGITFTPATGTITSWAATSSLSTYTSAQTLSNSTPTATLLSFNGIGNGQTTEMQLVRIGGTDSRSSGSSTFSLFKISPTINQTGTTSGNLAYINVDPTRTAVLQTEYGLLMRPTTTKSGFATGSTLPTSTLVVNGSFATGYVAKTATYTATDVDYTIECTANTFTVTLPTAVGIPGRIYNIVNSGAGTITIDTTSSQTFINVSATPTSISKVGIGTITVQSNGANWMKISEI